VKVIGNLVEGRLSVNHADQLLNLNRRQLQRLKKRDRPQPAGWVRHRNRGRSYGDTPLAAPRFFTRSPPNSVQPVRLLPEGSPRTSSQTTSGGLVWVYSRIRVQKSSCRALRQLNLPI